MFFYHFYVHVSSNNATIEGKTRWPPSAYSIFGENMHFLHIYSRCSLFLGLINEIVHASSI